jgi:hypothetical protein
MSLIMVISQCIMTSSKFCSLYIIVNISDDILYRNRKDNAKIPIEKC